MNLTAACPRIMVSADGAGLVSQAGAVLLAQTLRVTAWTAASGRPWAGGGRRGRCVTWGRSSWT